MSRYKIYVPFKSLALFLVFLGTVTTVWGQEQLSRRARAERAYFSMEYANAVQAYERMLDMNKLRTADIERLADSYLYIKEYELASNWFSRALQEQDAETVSRLKYAMSLQQQGKYAEAKSQYQQYIKDSGSSPELQRLIQGTDSAQVWMRYPTTHKLRNEQFVNTSLAEFGVYPTSGGVIYASEPNTFLATKSGMTGQSYLKVYSAERDEEGGLRNPNVMLDKFNDSPYHVGPVATNADENVLYVTRTYTGNEEAEKYKAHGRKWRKQNLELIIYRKSGDGWIAEDFPYNNVKEYSLGHASLSGDGQTLYYASDMPGGVGGVDIWYSTLQTDGSWGAPQHTGNVINTTGDEMFPNVFDDVLYYSSDGHIGMGGLDVFKSKGARNAWDSASHLGYPLNSPSDDFAFIIAYQGDDGYAGYVSSNRVGGTGSDDIYSFHYRVPKIKVTLEALTKNKETGALVPNTTVTVFDMDGYIVSKGVTDAISPLSFDLEPKKDYRLLAERNGYFPDSLFVGQINAAQDTVVRVTLNLLEMKVGTRFVLENIYYDFDQHAIRPDAAKILDKLVATMRDNPTLRIELSSHTDSRGSLKYNNNLSQRRAQAAVDYIVSRGIAKERLVAKGYGETRLVNKCADGVHCTPTEHQANRRTEVEVLAN